MQSLWIVCSSSYLVRFLTSPASCNFCGSIPPGPSRPGNSQNCTVKLRETAQSPSYAFPLFLFASFARFFFSFLREHRESQLLARCTRKAFARPDLDLFIRSDRERDSACTYSETRRVKRRGSTTREKSTASFLCWDDTCPFSFDC